MIADLLVARREVSTAIFFTQDRIAGAVAANNGDFIVRFNLRAPLSTCSVPQLRRRRRGEEEGGGGGGRDKDDSCTYVSVNDEDYRSFLAAEEKLKASPPNSLFSVQ